MVVKFHKIMFIVGAMLSFIGLLGLPALMMDYQSLGKFLIMLAPLGMLLMFTGLVVVVMTSPEEEHSHKMPD